ncbi:MAG: acyl-CoA dehydrogenase, partial [Syntrophomonadaceae bacterium]|nr:acyl-CoA dehydrogenase [Syntrophomonadaceae bacterium]
IQAYGGYGFCEEYPVAQIARDIKIYSIWEGTNFIQSLDLVGRKMGMAKGAAFAAFIQEIKEFCAANKDTAGLKKEFLNLGQALEAYDKIRATLNEWKGSNPSLIPVFSRRVLTATAQLHAGHLLLDQALICLQKMSELGPDHFDYKFYKGKVEATRWYLRNVVPNVGCAANIIADADTSALDIDLESFDY